MDMTDAELAELERLAREATAGPWTCGIVVDDDLPSSRRIVVGGAHTFFGSFPAAEWMGPRLAEMEANPQLAVAAVNALPRLLALLRTQREALAARRWRPASEHPPANGWYLVCERGPAIHISYWNGRWHAKWACPGYPTDLQDITDEVDHWTPLPDPPDRRVDGCGA